MTLSQLIRLHHFHYSLRAARREREAFRWTVLANATWVKVDSVGVARLEAGYGYWCVFKITPNCRYLRIVSRWLDSTAAIASAQRLVRRRAAARTLASRAA